MASGGRLLPARAIYGHSPGIFFHEAPRIIASAAALAVIGYIERALCEALHPSWRFGSTGDGRMVFGGG
jgi:hypothetical protein